MATETIINNLPLHITGRHFSNCDYCSSTMEYFFSTAYLTWIALIF